MLENYLKHIKILDNTRRKIRNSRDIETNDKWTLLCQLYDKKVEYSVLTIELLRIVMFCQIYNSETLKISNYDKRVMKEYEYSLLHEYIKPIYDTLYHHESIIRRKCSSTKHNLEKQLLFPLTEIKSVNSSPTKFDYRVIKIITKPLIDGVMFWFGDLYYNIIKFKLNQIEILLSDKQSISNLDLLFILHDYIADIKKIAKKYPSIYQVEEYSDYLIMPILYEIIKTYK